MSVIEFAVISKIFQMLIRDLYNELQIKIVSFEKILLNLKSYFSYDTQK